MAKVSSPWFRQSKNAWYVWHDGRQTPLGVKGSENEAQAVRAWHRLMAGLPPQPPLSATPGPKAVTTPSSTASATPSSKPTQQATVRQMLEGFLADCEGRVKPN